MNKSIFTFALAAMLWMGATADENWNIFYRNSLINPGINVQSELAVAPDGTLYLAELDYTDIYNTGIAYLHVRSYDISQWTTDNFSTDGWETVGQIKELNMANNEMWIDFAITPDNQLYAGMLDSILRYNETANAWESFYVPDYIGGMMVDESGRLLILQSVDISSNHRFVISEFENGTVTPVATIAYELPFGVTLFPRIMNEANRIFLVNGTFYVSVARASTNQNYYFKGNANDGFELLKEHFVHLNLSSMVVSPEGEIIISHRGDLAPYTLAMKKYDFEANDWVAFDMSGLDAGAAHASHLTYDRQGRLTFAYSGENNKGFVFRYGGNGWEHFGPKEAVPIAYMPKLAFDLSNSVFLLHGIGSTSAPLTVRRFVDETISVNETKAGISVRPYPNPAQTRFTVDVSQDFAASGIEKLSLFDQQGRLVRAWHKLPLKATLELDGLPAGLYNMVAEAGTERRTGRLSVY